MLDRRTALTALSGSALTLSAISRLHGAETKSDANDTSVKPSADTVTFGFITDVHHGTHSRDATPRLKPFIDAAIARKPDFILQCGDFTCNKGGVAACPEFLAQWNRFPGAKHHVIGNHDVDFNSKDDLVKAWNIPGPYYSFDVGAFHFVVLDRNYTRDPEGKFADYDKKTWYGIHSAGGPGYLARVSCAGPEQLRWLAADLAKTDKPTVIFMHEPVVVGSNEGNWDQVAVVLDRHNAKLGRAQVIAMFSGHDHDDLYVERHGIHYLTMNSAAFALNEFYGKPFYYDESKPPHTFVTLDAAAGELRIAAYDSAYDEKAELPADARWIIAPKIHERVLRFAKG